ILISIPSRRGFVVLMHETPKNVMTYVTAADAKVRALAALTTDLVEEARRRHDTHPTASAALGRVMTATAILGATLKDQQKVMVEVVGDGPLGQVVAEANAAGHVR